MFNHFYQIKNLMNKKLFFAVIFVISIVIARVNYAKELNNLLISNLTLNNIEALALGEETNKKGLPSSKEVVKYYYDDQGRLSSTETYKVYCCAEGNQDCSNTPCSEKVS